MRIAIGARRAPWGSVVAFDGAAIGVAIGVAMYA